MQLSEANDYRVSHKTQTPPAWMNFEKSERFKRTLLPFLLIILGLILLGYDYNQ